MLPNEDEVQAPHLRRPLLSTGKPVNLSLAAEVAMFYRKMLDHEHTSFPK